MNLPFGFFDGSQHGIQLTTARMLLPSVTGLPPYVDGLSCKMRDFRVTVLPAVDRTGSGPYCHLSWTPPSCSSRVADIRSIKQQRLVDYGHFGIHYLLFGVVCGVWESKPIDFIWFEDS